MTTADLTTADVVESTLYALGADEVLGIPLPRLVRAVMADPNILVAIGRLPHLDEVCAAEARRVAHCVAAGLSPDTVDGVEWFLPGVAQ